MTRVTIVHDYLTQTGGAERVLLALLRAFPDARLLTSMYDPELTFPEFADYEIETLWPNRVAALRRDHRRALPVLARAFSSHEVTDADVVLCHSSGWAHGVRTQAEKVVYCHSPARWLHQPEHYLRESTRIRATGLRMVRRSLLRWDVAAAQSATRYLTSSRAVAERIQRAYGLTAEVLPPPVMLDAAEPRETTPGIAPGFFLTVCRLLPYKNVDAVCAAMGELPDERLVVVGLGPDSDRLSRIAPPNVTFLPAVSEAQLRGLYADCAAVVSSSYEDFGLTPLEGNLFGKPAVVLRAGGFLDTVREGKTGLFFDAPEAPLIAAAMRQCRATGFDGGALRRHVDPYAESVFREKVRDVVLGTSAGAEVREAVGRR